MSNARDTVVVGVAGLGGYAGAITNLILRHGMEIQPQLRLAAVCDPQPSRFEERIGELRQQGIEIFDDYEQMLEMEQLQAVWLPVPIGLHAPFMSKALAAGKAVMCEKPAAGSIDEVDQMRRARDEANLPVLIGYQSIYQPTTLAIKRRLLSGELGKPRRLSLRGCSPRGDVYFARSDWAGKIQHQGKWILDSPAQNAMAHPVNLSLFLMGADEANSAMPVSVEAELYRAAHIENYDTVSARATLDTGVDMLVHLTHACAEQAGQEIVIETDKGHIQWKGHEILIQCDGRSETVAQEAHHQSTPMLQQFASVVAGRPMPDIGQATLEVARAHTLLINGISQAAPIVTVPEDQLEEAQWSNSTVRAIPGINEAFETCADQFHLLHDTGRYAFTEPGQSLDLRSYTHFAGPADMLRQAQSS